MDLAAGTRLGHYEIRSQIGAGGMSQVYLAEDSKLRRKVALKLLPADLTKNADRLRRFELEAQAASALNHPNIITVYDIGESEVGRFIVMDSGGSIGSRKVVGSGVGLASWLAS